MLTIKSNFDKTKLAKQAEKFPLAGSRALNETMKQARTFASKKVREIYNIGRSELRGEFTIIPAKKNNLIAQLLISGAPIGIIKFNPTQTAEGVAFAIRIGNQRTLLHGFIQQMQSGHIGVFTRTGVLAVMKRGSYKGKVREQIKERFTLDLSTMVTSKEFQHDIQNFIDENLPRILASKMKEL